MKSVWKKKEDYFAFLLKKLSNVPCFFNLLFDDGVSCFFEDDNALFTTGDGLRGGVEVAGLFVTIYPSSSIKEEGSSSDLGSFECSVSGGFVCCILGTSISESSAVVSSKSSKSSLFFVLIVAVSFFR